MVMRASNDVAASRDRRRLLALVALVVLLAACEPTQPPGAAAAAARGIVPAEILVRPASLTLRAGERAQLSAQVNDGAGQPIGGAPLEFLATPAETVRVSARGSVQAVGPAGQASVEVRSGAVAQAVTLTVLPGPPAAVRVVEGAGQTAVAGEALPAMVVVQVADAFGNRLPGTPVRFTVEARGAATQPEAATTDDQGLARVAWTLGRTAGPQGLRAVAAGGAASVDVGATAAAGPAARLVRVADADPPAGARSVTLRVQAVDAWGNGAAGVRVEWSTTGAPASLQATTETDDSGTAEAVLTFSPMPTPTREPAADAVAAPDAAPSADGARAQAAPPPVVPPGAAGDAAATPDVAATVRAALAVGTGPDGEVVFEVATPR